MSTATFTEELNTGGSGRPSWSERRILGIRLPYVLLGLILILSAALRFYNLGVVGDGNLYYTAAVKSMLQSWHNFFFVAAEPGGSVSIDKPPLGLWIQAASAFIFGVNGFAVILPEILCGLGSVAVLYHLVRRYFGSAAGLIAALALAVTPVAVAVERNNTMDSSLIFVLILAAWAFIKATETGKLRWLLAGAVLVGLGFNIKMLQAFLPLPAFYALYFLGAKTGWWRKIGYLAATTLVLLAVSLSWAVAVDLTPADQRPYVGSSGNNTVMNLIVGYNGVNRLVGHMGGGGRDGANGITGLLNGGQGPAGQPFAGQPSGQGNPPLAFDDGGQRTPPGGMPQAGGPGGGPQRADGGQFRQGGPGGGGPGGGMDTGQAGALRLFTTPLANEVGWLLPFGLGAAVLVALATRLRLPLETGHQTVILWGGWLVTEVVFFSLAGFFHPYYLAMLAPPLAALVGIGVARLWQIGENRRALASLLLIGGGAATIAYQGWVANQYTGSIWWAVPSAILIAAGAALLIVRLGSARQTAAAGFAAVVVAIIAIPAAWSAMTTLNVEANTTLPAAYSGGGMGRGGGAFPQATGQGLGGPGLGGGGQTQVNPQNTDGRGGGMGSWADRANDSLLTYLEANTVGVRYLLAVPSSMQGAGYVMATGRPVLYLGGFSGQDNVIDAAGLQALIEAGELRFVLWNGGGNGPGGGGRGGGNSAVGAWVQSNCTLVTDAAVGSNTLYRCGAN